MTVDIPEHQLRSATPGRSAAVPLPADAWDGGNGYGTRDAERDGVPVEPQRRLRVARIPYRAPRARHTGRGTRDAERGTRPSGPTMIDRVKAFRAERARDAERRAEQQRASRAERAAAEQLRRDALSRAATERRRTSRAGQRDTERPEDIAPVPQWMRVIGVWLSRTVGALPLIAPLFVSGYFTMRVFTDAPLRTPWGVALMITAALEGGVWLLSQIYEKTRIEGDSTIGLRIGIALYLVLISGLIYGHAYFLAWQDAKADGPVNGLVQVDISKWAPAAGVALMSTLGVFAWSKRAAYLHRARLRELEMVDPRTPKFASASWFWCPIETTRAVRHSVRFRISSPIDAVEDLRLFRATGRPRVWPVPSGFRYVDGTLVEVETTEQDDPSSGDGTRNTRRSTAGRGTTGRSTGRNGTPRNTSTGRSAGDDGTQDSDPGTGHDGTAGDSNGTGDETETGDGTRDETGDAADVLKFQNHLLAVTEAFPNWATMPKLPAVRAITAAINAHRQSTDGGTFNSNQISSEVQKELGKLRKRPELLDLIKLQVDAD